MPTTTEPIHWVKSSYSVDNGGACVEWAPANAPMTGMVPIRDSKRSDGGPVLTVSVSAFAGLVALARSADL
ncbi:DUF397 domain-containing protein [Streptomyces sp. NPDC059477]|uniref:DUF397 domain-containing protein n=1 Tax=Streptomyces sp. NPDC059477 TaxID=3346847 RepID=UPI0036CA370C